MILCCNCGIEINANFKNMCERCITNSTDLLSRIRSSMVIESCRGCERYYVPPKSWKPMAWGSQDLLIFCLQRNKSLKKLNIVDSSFVYTEEHSKKMNIEIRVEEDGVAQTMVLRFSIRNKQCGDCMRAESKQFWNSVVQLRQHPPSKRTFMYLEMLIKKHGAHSKTSNIKERKDGIDFYFLQKEDAKKLTKFLENFYGTRIKDSSRLISEDRSNNTANSKSTFSVEILPFCKDDLCIVDKSIGLGDYAIVNKVHNYIEFIHPVSGECRTISSRQYFGSSDKFKILQKSPDFDKFEVLLVNKQKYQGEEFYEASITKDQSTVHEIRTHIPLKEGDFVLGYEVSTKNFPESVNFVQDIVLVRKYNVKNYKMNEGKELTEEMRLFLDDISKDKEMMQEFCEVEEPTNEFVTQIGKLLI